MLVYSRVNHLM